MSGYPRIARQREIPQWIDDKTLAAASPITSPTLDVGGFNQLTLECKLTYVASTKVVATVFVCSDLGTPVWKQLQGMALAAGVETQSDLSFSKAQSGADDDWVINIPLNYKGLKVVFTSTGGTTDVLRVDARLALLQ
jgi:hypothetical protein